MVPIPSAAEVRAAGWARTREDKTPRRVLEVLEWPGAESGYLVTLDRPGVPTLDGSAVRPCNPPPR